MADKISGVDPNITNPNNSAIDQAPADPSNTSRVGQKVEQGVIGIKQGITEQSSEWEDVQERSVPDNTRVENKLKE